MLYREAEFLARPIVTVLSLMHKYSKQLKLGLPFPFSQYNY